MRGRLAGVSECPGKFHVFAFGCLRAALAHFETRERGRIDAILFASMEPIVEADDTDDDPPSRVWSVSSSAMNLDAEDEELVRWAAKVYGRGDFGRDGDASSKEDDSPRSLTSENEGNVVDFTTDTADTPGGADEPALESPADDSSEKGGGDKDVTAGQSRRPGRGSGSIFTSKDVRRQTVVIAKKAFSSVASVGLGLGYLAYLRVRHREQNDPNSCTPFVVHGGKALTRELLSRCPSLQREYELPKWCTNTHAQTLIGYGRMFTIFLEYDRQLVRCADGGQVGLDWLVKARFTPPARPPSTPEEAANRAVVPHNIPAACDLPDDAPVFIMLHGINGGSHEGPTKWAVATGAVRGWRCVALNLRGCNGVPLSSAKVYCAASAEDVRAAVDAARRRYPSAPILLAGYSLGTYVIGTYLAEENSHGRDPVAGAVLVSCPLDPHSSHAGLNRDAGLVYNGAITAELRRYYRKHVDVVGHVGGAGFSAKLIRDFERELIVATHGFDSVEEYYHYFAPQRIIPSIRTPTLYVVAKDDPFLGETEQCEAAIRGSSHVALAHVRKGGHVAFLEKGVGVFGPCWTDRVLGEFLASTLAPRSAAARAVDRSLKPLSERNEQRISREVFNGRWRENKENGGGDDALTSHVDPKRGLRIRSRL